MAMGVGVITISHCVQACVQAYVQACWLLVLLLFRSRFILEITEGETGKEIWSSVNYLVFISTSLIYGESQQIRQGTV